MADPIVRLNDIPLQGVDGAGVRWSVQRSSEGWWGSPDVETDATKKPVAAGSWLGVSTERPRMVSLVGLWVAPSHEALLAAVDDLNRAAAVSDVTLELFEESRIRMAAVRRHGEVMVERHSPTVAKWSISLIAADPRLYGPLQRTVVLPVQRVGGLRYPVRYPLRYHGAGAQSTTVVRNAGNALAALRLVAHGPMPDGVAVQAGGRTLAYDQPIWAGQSVVLDGKSRTASMLGVDVSHHLTSRQWSEIPAGGDLRLSLVGRSGQGWVDVEWADTWL